MEKVQSFPSVQSLTDMNQYTLQPKRLKRPVNCACCWQLWYRFFFSFFACLWQHFCQSVVFSGHNFDRERWDIQWLVDQLSCGVTGSHIAFLWEKNIANCNAVSVNYEYWNTQVPVWAQLSMTAKIPNPCHYKACMKLFLKNQSRAQCKQRREG